MKKVFYDGKLDDSFLLDGESSHHIVRVLRHPLEQPLVITDREGMTGAFAIENFVDGRLSLRRLTAEEELELIPCADGESDSVDIVLAQAYLKGDKFEFVLQKATELGVNAVYGLETKHCVAQYDSKKLAAKQSRWEKIVKEAGQQSNRASLPSLYLGDSLKSLMDKEAGAQIIVAYEAEDQCSLKSVLRSAQGGQRFVFVVGPEGGFASEEIACFRQAGAKIVSLGKNILRAETAALAVLAMATYELRME